MKAFSSLIVSIIMISVSLGAVGCGKSAPKEFVILSGSENRSLEPILRQFGEKNKTNIVMKYKGSIDIMQELGQSSSQYDAVWPANSLWISLGDTQRNVKHEKSIMTSPVAFGIRKSVAEQLGFVEKDVRVRDILEAIRRKELSFMMTSATQSNSGASAYLGFLYALLDNPDILTLEDLHKPQLKTEIKELLGGINRSSGSSGWLKDLFLEGDYDAMVNYESMLIEANQELVRQGKEPLYLVYPIDGIVFSDSPLGYIDRGDDKQEELFKQLQEYLLSDEVQDQILQQGRRTGIGGVMDEVDTRVFNPDWGIDVDKILSPIRLPAAEVIQEALNMYQTEFRKASLTVFCLDFSGSMKGKGVTQLKAGMRLLLDQETAKQYLINASSDDVNIVIPFSSQPIHIWQASGNDPADLSALLEKVEALAPKGGTDIYSPAVKGLELMSQIDLNTYVPAIILLTDGRSDGSFSQFESAWKNFGKDIPVFSIMFGKADEAQLKPLAQLTRGRVFDGRQDLVKAFRTAKGYN